MNNYTSKFIGKLIGLALAGAAAVLSTVSAAAGAEAGAATSSEESFNDSFHKGGYLAPMGSVLFNIGSGALGTRLGGTLAGGYRKDFFAFEARGFYAVAPSGSSNVRLYGGAIEGLIFPFLLSGVKTSDPTSLGERLFSNVYVIAGGGAQDLRNYPNIGNISLGTTIINGGVGDIIPLRLNQYEFGLRIEALYQHGFRDKDPSRITNGVADIDAPTGFSDIILNVGLQLPFGLTRQPATAPEPPVTVVPVAAQPVDTDGDGVPDNLDQCPNTPTGTKVGATGCPLPPPCKTPEIGEKISLAGCGTGDHIVLRGVNFNNDKSSLTVNAKTILDNVVSELGTYPTIGVEIDGYTDINGSHEHNQGLSERRAAAVKSYLVKHGIDDSRITTAGFAEAQPVADNTTDEGRELNRRVELKIVRGSAAGSAASTGAAAPDAATAPAPDAATVPAAP